MKGAIFKGIRDLVESTLGAEAWIRIADKAGCKEPRFIAGEDYPDAEALSLICAAAEVGQMGKEELMIEFGKFWVQNTAQVSYPTLFSLAGSSAREFLLNMNQVHDLVTRNVMGAHPPVFEYETLSDRRLLIHYTSARGLCPLLCGLILGVGIHFGENLTVTEIACMKDDHPRCTMEVVFQ